MPPKKQTNKPLLRTDRIPLPEFLRLLTEAEMTMPNAIAVAGKVYKTHNTPEKLGALTAADLAKMGIDSQDRRKEILDAVKKYKVSATTPNAATPGASTSKGKQSVASSGTNQPTNGYEDDTDEEDGKKARKKDDERQERALDAEERRRAALASLQDKFGKGGKESSPVKKRKRGRDDDLFTDPTPSSTKLGGAALYDFHEILDEEALKGRTVVINRAPVMMAWSCVVAEKLGFEREEALSIASAYTEMNATTKGASLGIYDKSKEKGMEPGRGTAQPHVELMGRRVALFQTENGQWRALLKGEPVTPDKAFTYITRSLAQMHPYLLGALTLLAQSIEDPQHLNNRAYSLYCDFRPENPGWGVKQEVKLATILGLRDRRKAPGIKEEEDSKTEEELKAPKKDASQVEAFEEFELEGDEGFTLMDLYESQD